MWSKIYEKSRGGRNIPPLTLHSRALRIVAEVDRLMCHHHPDSSGRADHRLAFSTRTMAAIIAHVRASADPDSDALGFDLDALASQRRARTSGLALRRAVLRSWRATATGAMAYTTTGTNGGSSTIGVGNRRACPRQVNACCGLSPCRLAISETTAPGTNVSSTIQALSSLENQRRRPVSVITSSRRAVTSDLSVWSNIDTSRSLQRDRETRLSHVPRECGSGTAAYPVRRVSCAGGPRGRTQYECESVGPDAAVSTIS